MDFSQVVRGADSVEEDIKPSEFLTELGRAGKRVIASASQRPFKDSQFAR
jgi:hypothetical protein